MTQTTVATLRAPPRRSGAMMPPSAVVPGAAGNRIGAAFQTMLDRVIASSSLVPNDAVLDVRLFPWTAALREHWRDVRDEAVALRSDGTKLLTIDLWKHGRSIADNLARCPATARLVRAVPGLSDASFSILAPGTHIGDRRGATKGLITCHLGLIVPKDGDGRMRIHDRVVRWAEGETLMFDDSWRHEVWNDADAVRVVLQIRFERPLRPPGKWVAGLVMRFLCRQASAKHRHR